MKSHWTEGVQTLMNLMREKFDDCGVLELHANGTGAIHYTDDKCDTIKEFNGLSELVEILE